MTRQLTPTAELLKKEAARRPPSQGVLVAMAMAGAIALGGVGFAIGRATAPAPTFAGVPNGFPGAGGAGQGPGNLGGPGAFGGGDGLALEGTVTSIDGDTLTLETANGSAITVKLRSGTTFHQEDSARRGDIGDGDTVRVGIDFQAGGTPGSGNVDATSVTLLKP